MDAQFHAVDIHIFDVHSVVKPLSSLACLQNNFQFLGKADDYRQQYASRQGVLTPTFYVHPLSQRTQKQNHFWKRYLEIWHGNAFDPWKLQVPFVCSPREPVLKLVTEGTGFEGKIRPIIYLSALGWSTNLNLHLSGDIKLPKLRDFIGQLRKSGPGNSLFKLQDKPQDLSQIFQHFSKKILQEVYSPDCSPEDTLRVTRYFVTSLSQFSGPLLNYKATLWTKGKAMNDDDRALLHSILLGRPINVPELAQILKNKQHTFIPFKGPDFALAYFEKGILAFLQQGALKGSGRRASISCFASNIRTCSMMIWSLLNFYKESGSWAKSNPLIEELREAVKFNLQKIPSRYTNEYCRALYSNHAELKGLMPKDAK
jgi:hypothetical protein